MQRFGERASLFRLALSLWQADSVGKDDAAQVGCVIGSMKETVTITHHLLKPEYQWEISIEDQSAVMLRAEGIEEALQVLGVDSNGETVQQILQLPDGESRAVDVDLQPELLAQLRVLSVK